MQATASDVEAGPSTQPSNKQKARPQQGADCLLSFCRLINLSAGCTALLCLVAHAMAISVAADISGLSSRPDAASYIQVQVLRLYGIATSVLVLLIETEWEWLLSWLRACENWVGRGLLQGFLGVLTLELAHSTGTSDFDRSLLIYRQVAGYAMIAFAGFYFIGGLLCIGILKKARHRRSVERLQVAKDLELLDKQREELRAMLTTYGRES